MLPFGQQGGIILCAFFSVSFKLASLRPHCCGLDIRWEISRCLLATQAPDTVNASVSHSHSCGLDIQCYPYLHCFTPVSIRFLRPPVLLFIACCLNIGIWRKFQHGRIGTQENSAASQNQRLTKTLLFVSIVALLSWLPVIVVHFVMYGLNISIHWRVAEIGRLLCYSNSFLNPVVYALRIPEYRQALRLCCVRRQAPMDLDSRNGRDNRAAALTPVIKLKTLPTHPNHLQLECKQQATDTRL